MGRKKVQPNYRRRTLRLPDLDHSKLAVLNSLGSPGSRRVYEFALNQFIAWYCSEPRLALQHIAPHDLREAMPYQRWRDRADSIPAGSSISADYRALPRMQAEHRASGERPVPAGEHNRCDASELLVGHSARFPSLASTSCAPHHPAP